MQKMDLFQHYHDVKDMNILLQFKGALSQEILIEMGEIISKPDNQFNREIHISFSVFVEMAQNIMNYSSEKELINGDKIGVGIIVFTENEKFYNIYSGNIIKNEDEKMITDRINEINKASSMELKEMYKKQTARRILNRDKSGGLGLLLIARLSNNNIGFLIKKVNNRNSFLELHVKINKEEAEK